MREPHFLLRCPCGAARCADTCAPETSHLRSAPCAKRKKTGSRNSCRGGSRTATSDCFIRCRGIRLRRTPLCTPFLRKQESRPSWVVCSPPRWAQIPAVGAQKRRGSSRTAPHVIASPPLADEAIPRHAIVGARFPRPSPLPKGALATPYPHSKPVYSRHP